MNQYPMLIKWQKPKSRNVSRRQIENDIELQKFLALILRRNAYNWWLIRMEDDVVLAQSKGYRP